MKGEKLLITIDEATGEVTVTANGFVGKGCSAVQDAISADLGTVLEVKTKPEFYQTETRKGTVTRGN